VSAPRVGIVGLGAMGRPIARHLVHAGFEVIGYDRAGGAPHEGVRLVGDLREVAAADVAIVIVPTDEDVAEVVTGLVDAGHPGLVVVVSSSVSTQTCRDLARLAAGAGIDLVDAALTGGVRGAESASLNLLVGGDPAVVERVRDVLLAFARDFHILGGVGAGQVAKTASNLIHWAEIVAIDEAFRFAAVLGVEPAALRRALQHGGTDSRTLREIDLMRFTWYAKDFAVANRMAQGIGMDLPVASLARRLMDSVTAESVRQLFG
jgi:3-hydroxyisobutyrate dehydrogenase